MPMSSSAKISTTCDKARVHSRKCTCTTSVFCSVNRITAATNSNIRMNFSLPTRRSLRWPKRYSRTAEGHVHDQHRAGAGVAAGVDVAAHHDDLTEHVAQIARHRDLLLLVLNLAAFHTEAGGAARVIAGDEIVAHAHHLGDDQARAHAPQQRREIVGALLDGEIVHAAGF